MRLFGSYILQDGRVHIFTNVTILFPCCDILRSSNSLQNDQRKLWCFEIKQCAIAFLPSHLNGRQYVSVSWLSYTGKVWRNDGRVKSYMKSRMASVHLGHMSCAVPVFYQDTWWLRSTPVWESEFIVREGRSNRRKRVINTSLLSSPLWVSVSFNLVLAHNVFLKPLLNFYQCSGFRTLQLWHCQF